MIHNRQLASAVDDLRLTQILNNLRRAVRGIHSLQVRSYPSSYYDPNVPLPTLTTGPWPPGTVEQLKREFDRIARDNATPTLPPGPHQGS